MQDGYKITTVVVSFIVLSCVVVDDKVVIVPAFARTFTTMVLFQLSMSAIAISVVVFVVVVVDVADFLDAHRPVYSYCWCFFMFC